MQGHWQHAICLGLFSGVNNVIIQSRLVFSWRGIIHFLVFYRKICRSKKLTWHSTETPDWKETRRHSFMLICFLAPWEGSTGRPTLGPWTSVVPQGYHSLDVKADLKGKELKVPCAHTHGHSINVAILWLFCPDCSYFIHCLYQWMGGGAHLYSDLHHNSMQACLEVSPSKFRQIYA